MPIYEYACRSCGREFETLVRNGSTPDCPHCRSTELEKKLSVFATGKSMPAEAPAPEACASCPHAGSFGSCAAN